MPFGLESLSDTQRKALLIGVPAVALVAVGTRIGKKDTPAEETPTVAPPTGYIPAASTDAIGVGQLADFESKISAGLQALWGQLGNSVTTPANPTPTTTPTGPTAESAAAGLPTVGIGSSGPAVFLAQGTLYQNGLYPAVDGHWGESSAQVLRGFQASHGLTATGTVNAATWKALAASTGVVWFINYRAQLGL